MSTKVNAVISAIWRHSNIPIQFSEEWEWSDDIDDDLNSGFYGWVNLDTQADILESFTGPSNWQVLSVSAAPYDLEEFQPESLDLDQLSVLIEPRVNWNTYLDTIMVPFRFDPNVWVTLDTRSKLVAMGQIADENSLNSDGVLFSSTNSGYFDLYISGCLELSIEIQSDDQLEARDLAIKEIHDYFTTAFTDELSRLLPKREGDPNFDESTGVYLAPNWVLIQG